MVVKGIKGVEVFDVVQPPLELSGGAGDGELESVVVVVSTAGMLVPGSVPTPWSSGTLPVSVGGGGGGGEPFETHAPC